MSVARKHAARKHAARDPWTPNFGCPDTEHLGAEVGWMRTPARAASERSRVAAAARTFDGQSPPALDVIIESPDLRCVGTLTASDGFTFEWRDPQALRDLAAVLLRVADEAEASGVFERVRSRAHR